MQINHSHRSKDKSVAKTKDADLQRTMETGRHRYQRSRPGEPHALLESNLLTRVSLPGQTHSAHVRQKMCLNGSPHCGISACTVAELVALQTLKVDLKVEHA